MTLVLELCKLVQNQFNLWSLQSWWDPAGSILDVLLLIVGSLDVSRFLVAQVKQADATRTYYVEMYAVLYPKDGSRKSDEEIGKAERVIRRKLQNHTLPLRRKASRLDRVILVLIWVLPVVSFFMALIQAFGKLERLSWGGNLFRLLPIPVDVFINGRLTGAARKGLEKELSQLKTLEPPMKLHVT
jgi:hypothetical protein